MFHEVTDFTKSTGVLALVTSKCLCVEYELK